MQALSDACSLPRVEADMDPMMVRFGPVRLNETFGKTSEFLPTCVVAFLDPHKESRSLLNEGNKNDEERHCVLMVTKDQADKSRSVEVDVQPNSRDSALLIPLDGGVNPRVGLVIRRTSNRI